jgi:hydroxyacylglutathione hydrolase
MSLKVSSTIGFERAHQPPNFRNIALDRGPLVMEVAEAHPLTPRQVEQAGGLVVDVRTELQFDEAHIPGAVSITARRAGFGSKLAWPARPGEPIVLVGRDDADALDAAVLAAARRLRRGA